jgi:hypothetical protein
MNPARRIGFIPAALLLVNSLMCVPAIAQQDEAVALDKGVLELYQAGKFPEANRWHNERRRSAEKRSVATIPMSRQHSTGLAFLYTNQGRYTDAASRLTPSMRLLPTDFLGINSLKHINWNP